MPEIIECRMPKTSVDDKAMIKWSCEMRFIYFQNIHAGAFFRKMFIRA